MLDDDALITEELSYKKTPENDFAKNCNSYKKVTLECADGSSLSGYTKDFYPNIPFFHFSKSRDSFEDKETVIYLEDVKRIVFDDNGKVNSIANDQRNKGDSADQMEIIFKDGEILTGTVVDYRPNSFGLFVLTNQVSNPTRVFVTSAAIRKIRYLDNLLMRRGHYSNS